MWAAVVAHFLKDGANVLASMFAKKQCII